MDYVLIEYVTSAPEWVTSWWMIGILIVVVAVVMGYAIDSASKVDKRYQVSEVGLGIVVSVAVVMVYVSSVVGAGGSWVKGSEKERVAVEVSQATGQDVNADEVADMLGGDYVPGVNYDKLSSDSGKFFKVEVG